MFYCEDCDNFVEETKLIRCEDPEIWHQGFKHVCPLCNSEEIKEAVKCAKCGKYVAEIETNGRCLKCVNELQLKALDFIKQFDAEEQEIIIDYLTDI
ncbi:MAG: hypothetical protein E7365_06145 [Clostridiales bacterium]|nr:hypothetical protein [Clostridiales bacterium]